MDNIKIVFAVFFMLFGLSLIQAQVISRNDSLRLESELIKERYLAKKELVEHVSAELPLPIQQRIDSLKIIRDNREFPPKLRLSAQDKIVMSLLYRNTFLAFPELKRYVSMAQAHSDSLFYLGRAYHDIGLYYQKIGNLDSAAYYYNQELLFSKQKKYKSLVLNAMVDLCLLAERKGNYDEALQGYLEVIDSSLSQKMRAAEARARINTGSLLFLKGDYVQALEHLNLALDICLLGKKLNGFLASNYIALGDVNTAIGEYEQAEDYFIKALKWSDVMNNAGTKRFAMVRYINYYKERKKYDKGLLLTQRLIDFDKGQELSNNNAESLTLMASFFLDLEHLDSAKHYIQQALAIQNKATIKEKQYQIYALAGAVYLQSADWNVAEKYCKEAYELTKNKDDYKYQRDNCYCLYKVQQQKGHHQEALAYLEEYMALNASLKNEEKTKEVVKTQLKSQFKFKHYQDSLANEQEKKMMEEEHQQKINQQKSIAWGLGSGLLFLILVAVVLWYAFRQNKRQKDELAKLNQLNKQIFSIISHDFRSPMMTMNFMAEALVDSEMDEMRMRLYLKDIKNQIAQTSNILENLLNWARAELQLDIKQDLDTNLYQIICELEQFFATKLEEKEISFISAISKDISLSIHPDLLRIVLRNLLSNAIKYSHQEGKIELSYDAKLKQITLKDTGVGMNEKQVEHLFKQPVFSQMGTDEETGFGIGLYISAELLRKIGWSITVQSEKGKGTCFFVNAKK